MQLAASRPVIDRLLRTIALATALLLAAAPLTTAPARAASHLDCPPVRPASDLVAGQRGTGLTVVRGGVPTEFNVEVLGVLPNAIAPGRDMIIVDTSPPDDPSQVVEDAGGIWFGMSGSPVHIDGELIGAVAYGLGFGPSSIGGLTPATDMVALFDDPARAGGNRMPGARLDEPLARVVAEREGARAAASDMQPLRTPLAVSGVGNRRIGQVADLAERHGASVVPFAAASVSQGGAAATATPVAGGNFAGVLSYGDVSAAGIGTTTVVCDGRAVAFGHPFAFLGSTTMGANDANALTVVDDAVFGPFKLATIAGTFGRVDEDRLAGVRALLGIGPALSPITSTVRDLDRNRVRAGARTDVATPTFMPMLSFLHLLSNLDVVIDRVGPGTSSVGWELTGTRAEGASWTLSRSNRYASSGDIAFESVFELLDHLFLVAENPFEDVALTSVALTADVEQAVRRQQITDVSAWVEGVEHAPGELLAVAPGDTIGLTVTTVPRDRSGPRTFELDLTVPDDAGGFAYLEVFATPDGAFFDGDPSEAATFDELITLLESAPRSDDIVARLTVGSAFESEEPASARAAARAGHGVVEQRLRTDLVTSGYAAFDVEVGGDPGGPGEPGDGLGAFARIAGATRIETAVELSRAAHPSDGAPAVVLARADDYPDALAGAPLARALGGPLLLTNSDSVAPAVAEEIARLGASEVVLLGGTSALDEAVADELADTGVDVRRLGGASRFETAAAIADELGGESAFLVQGVHDDPGRGWPDAVAVSGLAATTGRPILLTTSSDLPEATRAAIAGRRTAVTIVGGPVAVGPAVAEAVAMAGATVDRLAGATRYETSATVAAAAAEAGSAPGRVWFATGRAFPDALAAGPAVAADGGVLVLIDGADAGGSPSALSWLRRVVNDGTLEHVRLVGGRVAISDTVEALLAAIAQATDEGPPFGDG